MKIVHLVLAASLSIGMATAAFAQDQGGGMSGPSAGGGARGGRMAACADDRAKYCADQRGPAMRSCLMQNQDKVSAACKAVLSAPPPAAGGMSGPPAGGGGN